MQKRRIGAMGGFLLAGAVLLSGCSSPVGGETGVAQKLSGSFTTEMTMNMEEQTVSGTLSRMGDGMWSVSFAEPATLAGVVLDFSGGEVTASYQGLAFSVPQTAMPAKSILSSLILVVDDLAKQEHISGEKDGDYVSVEGELEAVPTCCGSPPAANLPDSRWTIWTPC